MGSWPVVTPTPGREARGTASPLHPIEARALAEAALAVAERFASGATMWCIAPGAVAHARHIAVEFVHPVLVGKPALPAVSVHEPDLAAAIGAVARRGDVLVALGSTSAELEATRQAAVDRGVLPVWIGFGERPEASTVGHVIWLSDPAGPPDGWNAVAHDGCLVRHYHLLWELTHVCLEHGIWPDEVGAAEARTVVGASDFLYPFLSGASGDSTRLLEDLTESAMAKADESADLQAETLRQHDATLETTAAEMTERFDSGGRLFTFGNGGSSTDADVLASLFADPPFGPAHAAHSLVDDSAVLTALANDVGYDLVFARQLIAIARPDDIAIGVSTSGNSRNLLAAFGEAKRRGLLTIGLAGSGGGAMATSEDIDALLLVDSDRVHRIQETQAALGYELWRRVTDQRERLG